MPRAGQIIPEYLVPHVQTYINDNSTFTETEAVEAADDSVRLMCVFASSKGEDNVVKKITSTRAYVEEYGTPNYSLYGQPGYMPYRALASGKAICYCMRVMPKTATYSNVIISALAKVETDPTTSAKTFNVKLVADYVETLTDKDSLYLQLENLEQLPPETDTDGYSKFPLIGFCSKGRGVYGNNYYVRIVPEITLNSENNYLNYVVQILENDNGVLSVKEYFTGCIDTDAFDGLNTMFIDDVINDPSEGSAKIIAASKPANLQALYNMYKSNIEDDSVTVPAFDKSNLLTGLTKDGASMINYKIDTENSIVLDSTTGIVFDKGSDSTFDPAYNPGDGVGVSREEAMNQVYIEAFEGKIDTAILSKRRTPVELILDANFDENVKLSIVSLGLKRKDARVVIDAGLLPTVAAVSNWVHKDVIAGIDSFFISKECNNYKVRDAFTGKIIPVTYTYHLANVLPTHYKNVGNQVPFVGDTYSPLTGHIPNSVKPTIDADDLELKDELYTARCNFLECIAENTYIRGVQGTSQTVWSDLSEENNVAVLLDMKRELELFVSRQLYNFAEPDDRRRFTETATELLRPYNVVKVRSYEIYFDMNSFEETRSILHCYLAVTFKTMAKRGIIEIDINKRV